MNLLSIRWWLLIIAGLVAAVLLITQSESPKQAQIRSGLQDNTNLNSSHQSVTKVSKRGDEPGHSSGVIEGPAATQQVAQSLESALEQLKQDIQASKLEKQVRDRRFQNELSNLASLNEDGALPTLTYGPGQVLRAVAGRFAVPGGDLEASTESFISAHPTVFGFSELETPVITQRQSTTMGSVLHVDRRLGDWPVWGRQLVVSESEGRIVAVTGKMMPVPELDTRANLDELRGLEIAQSGISDWSGVRTAYSAQKGVFVFGDKAHFASRFQIESSANKAWDVYVSLNTQEVLSTIPKHYESTSSEGEDLLGVKRTFNSELSSDGSAYVLKDTSFPIGTTGTGVGYDDPDSDKQFYVASSAPDSGWRKSAVSAIHNARATYDYFYNTHDRNSFNANSSSDTPQPLLAIVDVLEEDGSGLDNAYWYGGTMYYGKGSSFKNLAASLDVAAHEFGHGVVEYTAGLRYHNQSGALNESFADLFGVMVDRDDWLIGEDLYSNGSALRDMQTPENGGQPSTFADYRHLPDTRDGDWGGVHYNSGIQNRALYLMAEGLTKESLGTSIGRDKTERIAYQALLRLGEDAEFVDAFVQMKLVATQLYDDATAQSVEAAWAAVGIAETTVPESDNKEIEFSLAAGSDAVAYLYAIDGTFDYSEEDSYQIYVYYTDSTATQGSYSSDNDLGPINDFEPALIRPALYTLTLDDGSAVEIVIYVRSDGQLVLADALNAADDSVVESEFTVNSVAISPDGSRIVYVLDDSRYIGYVSLVNEDAGTFEVLGPDYSAGESDSPVQRVDSINFDFSGSKVVFDFLSCRPNLDGSDCIPFWSIGVVDIESGAFEYPFPGQDELIDLGYPQFSNQNNDVFVFDFLDYRPETGVDSLVLAYNRETDTFSYVGTPDPDSIHGGIFSLPTVRGDDASVLFQYYYTPEGENPVSQDRIFSVAINEFFEGQVEGTDFLFSFGAGYAESHRSGIQDLSADLVLSTLNVNLGETKGNDLVGATLTIKNSGARDIEIASVAPSEGIRTNLTSTIVNAGETLTFTVGIRPSDFGIGEVVGSVIIDHDGDSQQKNIKVTASVLDSGETDGADTEGTSDASDTGGSSDGGSDDGSGSGGDTDAGVGSDDTDGDGIPDDRDPEPEIDNSEQLAHYRWIKDRMSWLEARDYAEAQGGYLASITSQLENDLIYAIVSEGFDENSYQTLGYADDGGGATYVYIGASDRAAEGTFVWESGDAFSFTNWGQAEPDNFDGNQNVVGLALENWPYQASDSDAYGLTSQWNDISENNELTFVIEFDEAQTGRGDSDGGTTDSGETDGGTTDDGETDSGTTDEGSTSGGTNDGGSTDGNGNDGGTDGGTSDVGSTGGDTTGGDSGFESEAGILDIDGDGKRAALSDGLLIIRHLFGFQGTSLISGAVSQSATVTEAVDIATIIESHRQDFDIDKDGETKPLTDGLLIIRHLFGFEGASLVAGATSASSTLTVAEIAANLKALESYTDDGSGGGTADDGEVDAGGTDNGSGTSDGGASTAVDVLLKVTYDRVNPVTDLSNGYYQAKLDYDAIEALPGRYLSVEVIDADTDQTFESDWITSAEGLASGQLPVDRSFYFKIRAKSEVSGTQGKWSVSIHDNQGSTNTASYPQYVVISDTFTTSTDRSIEVDIKSGWTGAGYASERAAAPFAIMDTVIDAMLLMARNSSGLEYPPLEVYWSKDNTIANIGTSFYSGGIIYILGGVDEDTDEYDKHVIVHEWGHYLQDKLSRDDSPGGPHGSGDILDPRIAFSEGWANALSGIVLGDSDYKDTNGAEQAEGFYLPMEEGFPSNVVEVTTGWFSEDSVAEIVLDLFDTNNDLEDADTVSLSITEMTSALVDEVPETPVATTIFSLLKPLISANQEEETAIRALLQNHSIALDAGEIDVYGSYEQVVSAGVTDNALPIFTSIEVDGEAVRVCQDNKHTPEDYLSSEADANKLGNRTLGRFLVTESGSFDFSATSGIQGGLGRSDDPDLLVYKLGQQIAYNSNSGAVSESLYDLTVGEYWFVLYDYGFLAGKQSSAPCQLVEIKKK